MAAEHWFRWHHGTATDPKWRVIASRCVTNVTVGHVVTVWAAMLENASQASPRGTLQGWDDEDIAALFGYTKEQVTDIRRAMQGKTLDGDRLAGWEKRQPNREDSSADRTRKYRERKSGSGDGKKHDVTQCDAAYRTVTLETETETETEKEEREKPNAPASPPLTPAPKKSVKPKRSQGETLAAWLESLPPEEMAIRADDPVYAYAERVGLPESFLPLQWAWFKCKYVDDPKTKQLDWRAKFRKSVEGGWGNHWRIDQSGAYYLTTQGKQLERSLAEDRA